MKAQNFAKHAIANAQTTTVEAGAQILADGGAGGGSGSGGNVVVWSDKHTVFAGAISVTGGAQGGDGGFVETSSHGVLAFTGTANRLAPNGKAGTLLLDPEDLDIVAGAAGASMGTTTTGGTISSNANTSTLTTGDLSGRARRWQCHRSDDQSRRLDRARQYRRSGGLHLGEREFADAFRLQRHHGR